MNLFSGFPDFHYGQMYLFFHKTDKKQKINVRLKVIKIRNVHRCVMSGTGITEHIILMTRTDKTVMGSLYKERSPYIKA